MCPTIKLIMQLLEMCPTIGNDHATIGNDHATIGNDHATIGNDLISSQYMVFFTVNVLRLSLKLCTTFLKKTNIVKTSNNSTYIRNHTCTSE